jgi:hypothetical protein
MGMSQPKTVQHDPRWRTVRRYLRWLHDHAPQALQRISAADQWCTGDYVKPDGRRCLRGHAADWQIRGRDDVFLTDRIAEECPVQVISSFEGLAQSYGLAPVAAAIRQSAADLCRERGIGP